MWEYIVVAIILGVTIFLALRSAYRTLTGGQKMGCGCGSSGAACSSRSASRASDKLVTINIAPGIRQ